MMQKQNEAMAHQRSAPRWKEWIPLVTQQLRLRNLIQVIAYNVGINGENSYDLKVNWGQLQKSIRPCCSPDSATFKQKAENKKFSFYYTLHLTTMSAPFYTSEKLESENPKWEEIEINELISTVNAAVNGIVVRLWLHRKEETDIVLTVWGVYFNGLIYLGPRLCSNASSFCSNTIVFHMHGGYFTAPDCFKEQPQKLRNTRVALNQNDVRPSYTVNLLLRLHTVQQAIKKQMFAAQSLREKIILGGLVPIRANEGESLFRLLNSSQSKKNRRQEIVKLKQEIEKLKFRVSLLSQEKRRKHEQLVQIEKKNSLVAEKNQERGMELMAKYELLYKESEQLKEWRKSYLDARESFLLTNAQLNFRRKQLISELNFIYPIAQESTGKFTIAGVHLPNSEEFGGQEESTISVTLGYVAHVVQMVSIFLQVPLRYPIIHFGSRSKVVDHISEKIPDKDREFPLFSRGKDKLQFNYGVYLLNKNIAQLRWYCGLSTHDLRATLPNLASLLQIGQAVNGFQTSHHTVSSSSLDLRSSSQNISSPGSVQTVFRKGHRVSKSMGSTELRFQVPVLANVRGSIHPNGTPCRNVIQAGGTSNTSNNLSYSLDKGLDEYHELKKSEDCRKFASNFLEERVSRGLGHVGSEPILTNKNKYQTIVTQETEATSSADEGQKKFLQHWQAHGPAPVCSDDDVEVLQTSHFPSELRTETLENEVNENKYKTENGAIVSVEIVNGENQSNCIPYSTNSVCENNLDHDDIDSMDNICLGINAVNENEYLKVNITPVFEESRLVTDENQRDFKNGTYVNCTLLPDNASNFSNALCPIDGVKHLCTDNVIKDEKLDVEKLENNVPLNQVSNIGGETVLVDSIFETMAVRTEALASRSGSFNLVRSRHSSMIDD